MLDLKNLFACSIKRCAGSRGIEDESAIRKDNKRIIERDKREKELQRLEDHKGLKERRKIREEIRVCDFIRELKVTISLEFLAI